MKKIIRTLVEQILTICAKLILHRHRPTIIAITGSAGKTTTKYTVGRVLEVGFTDKQVRIGHGNLGTKTGVPLALLNIQVTDMNPLLWILLLPFVIIKTLYVYLIPFYPKYLVLEVSADLPGGIEFISMYLRPYISIITNVGAAHLEYFKNQEGIKLEKQMLVTYTQENGLVILNGHDPLVRSMQHVAKAKVKTIETPAHEFAGKAAALVAAELGLSQTVINKGLKSVQLPRGRFDILSGREGTTLIDSTYNANPVSVKATLERMQVVSEKGSRKIVVLGDMLELGPDSKKYHEQVGQEAKVVSDYFIAVGPQSKIMPADFWTTSKEEAALHLLKVIQPGDTILVKASHGMNLEYIVQKMKAEHVN